MSAKSDWAITVAAVGPVSYTHLDVYKRQGQPYKPFENAITEWWYGLRRRAAVSKKCLPESQSREIAYDFCDQPQYARRIAHKRH